MAEPEQGYAIGWEPAKPWVGKKPSQSRDVVDVAAFGRLLKALKVGDVEARIAHAAKRVEARKKKEREKKEAK
jgi:hypothetical protein